MNIRCFLFVSFLVLFSSVFCFPPRVDVTSVLQRYVRSAEMTLALFLLDYLHFFSANFFSNDFFLLLVLSFLFFVKRIMSKMRRRSTGSVSTLHSKSIDIYGYHSHFNIQMFTG